MKPPAFTYHRPATVEEAVQILDRYSGEGAKVLAGGQSLVPLMSMRLASPGHLVDINHLPGLDTVEATSTGVRDGALARHSRVEHYADAYAAVPLLRQALSQVAHPTIRNRGTTVGSLVHGDPAAEMTAVLAVLDGEVELVGPRGSRTVAATDFFVGPMETEHADAEVAVDLAPAIGGSGGGIDEARATELVDAAIDPEDDIHATAAYRRHLAHVLTRRAVAQAHDAARATRRAAA